MTHQGQHFTGNLRLGRNRLKRLWAPVLVLALFGTMAAGEATSARAADPFVPSASSIPVETPNIELTNLTITGGSIVRPAPFAGNRTIYWVMPDTPNGGTVTVTASAPTGATLSYTLDGVAQAGSVFNLNLSASRLMSEIGITVTDGTRANHYYLDVSSQDPSSYPVVEQYYPNMKPYDATTAKTLVLTDQFQEDSSVVNPGVLSFIAQYLEGSQKNPSIITGPVLAQNPAWHSLHYHLAIWNNPTAAIIWNDEWTTVEWDQLADLFDTDPGIFMYAYAKDTGNVSPLYDSAWGSYLMNITNENYYQWLLAAIIDQCRTDNYDSVFLDSYTMDTVYSFTNFNYVNYDGTALATYQDPQLGGMTWAQASEEFMARLTRDLNRAGIWSLPNLGNQRTSWDPVDYAYSNGGMFEEAIDTPTVAVGDWQQDMSRYIYLSNKDKVLIFQAYGVADINDVTTRLYETAAYQMCRGNYTYMNEVVGGQSEASWYPEYGIGAMLGAPTETAITPDAFDRSTVDPVINQYQIGSSPVYERQFQNGLVAINGDASGTPHDFTVPDGPSYVSVTIQPGSGGTVTDAGISAITSASNYPLIETPVSAGQVISLPANGSVILVAANSTVPVDSVTVTPSTAALTVGDTTTLTATIAPSNATNKALTWRSSNTAAVTVDQTGVVTAVGPGLATITATAQDGSGKSGNTNVTVTAPVVLVTSVTLSSTTAALTTGDTTTLTATVAPTDATNKALTWSSSNTAIATVDQTGKVTAVGPGLATITATAQDGSGKSGNTNITVTAPVVLVTSVTLSSTTAALTTGDTTTLTATVAPTDATNKTLTWSSSNTAIATVDQTGKVTAVGPGLATITATAQDGSGKSGSTNVTVTAPVVLVTSVTLSSTTAALTTGDTTTLTATVAPTDATNKTLTWSSSNTAIATVDQTGKVTAVGPGLATITATAQDGSGKSGNTNITVTAPVVLVTSVTLSPTTAALTTGDTTTLTATVAPSNATNKTLTWSSSNTAIATVDQTGVVTAVGPGLATITATAQDGSGKSGNTNITVTAPVIPITSVTVTPSTVALTTGDTTTLTATIAPSNATNKTLTWSSSNTAIATVDQTGKVTAVGPGLATITATAQDGTGKTGTSTITVTAASAVASAANSTFTKASAPATTTGGAARLADGTDAFTFTITLRDTAGRLVPGQTSVLSVAASSVINVTAITDNHDGTYTLTATTTTPGNYQITASLSGTQIGGPLAINFLSAVSLQAKVTVGQVVTANATGFQSGEQVTVTAHSTPVNVGVFTADDAGRVTAQFKVPADFNIGGHFVDFTGAVSGSVTAAFEVIATAPPVPPAPPASPAPPAQASTGLQVSTGGNVAGWPINLFIALTLLGLATIPGTISIKIRVK